MSFFGGTIQGRLFRTLVIVCLAMVAFTGVGVMTVTSVKDSFARSGSELSASYTHFLQLKVALEQTIAGLEAGPDAARKGRLAFAAEMAAMKRDFANRRWLETALALNERFLGTEKLSRDNATIQLIGLRDALEQIRNRNRDEIQSELFDFLNSTLTTMLVLAMSAILLVAAYFWWTSSSLNKRLDDFARSLQRVSEENDETSEVMRDASQELSSASSEQSAAVQESVASIAEIRSMLAQTSNHVREVRELSETVNESTSVGSQTMAKMESAMLSIEGTRTDLHSFGDILKSIREKTQVINDIVFKTQLLSFNASIEAARAGQYGRGFAVVAEEVGKLAQLSGSASRDIDQLLTDSEQRVVEIIETVSSRVADGKEVSQEALRRFGEIATQVEIISDKINLVGEATLEQEGGVEQTAKAMDQMDASALNSKRSADGILKIAEKMRALSGQIREVSDGIDAFIRSETHRLNSKRDGRLGRGPRPEGSGEAVVDLVSRLAQKRAPNSASAASLMNADDPSFRKVEGGSGDGSL